MIDKMKDVSFYVVVGLCISSFSAWIESDFLERYLNANLITLLVALLAINTTTISVVMTKLREISDATGGSFSSTTIQLKHSIYEQIIYIVVATVVLIISGSNKAISLHTSLDFILDVLLVAVFVAALHTLFDTARSIFVILKYENKM